MEPKQLQNFLITLITTLSALIVLFIEYDRVKAALFPNNNFLNLPFFVLALILTALVVFLIMYGILYREKKSHKGTLVKYHNMQAQLADKERELLTDVITGIPNESKFKKDISKIKQELYHLILIDIDNFSSVNKKSGYLKGDELIRSIAQNLYSGMRRNEEIYKREGVLNKSFTKRIYRKYRGGDEFIFLIKGPQHEAVGFLTRINSEFENYSKQAEAILGYSFSLKFHGAISPFYPGESFEHAYKRLHTCFVLAAENKDHLRVYWYKNEAAEFQEGDFRKTIYQRASQVFRSTWTL